jgi:TatD DNase family protein
LRYFDTHCHLNHDSFVEDLSEVLQRADHSLVTNILVPGWNAESSQKAVRLAEEFPNLVAAVGIHPTECGENGSLEKDTAEIEKLALHPKVVAIGEIGLDYYHDATYKREQSELLIQMLQIAEKVKKPVILHSRESMEDMLGLLLSRKERENPGILHAYEGNREQAMVLSKKGYSFGMGGQLTYKNSLLKHEVFQSIPVEQIVLETDAPYLTPVPYRGKRNEPAFLPSIGKCLSVLRNQPEEELLEQIYKNSYKIFL